MATNDLTIIGLMKVRNEQWVLRASLEAALRTVDHVIILNHASTDDTGAIIDEASARHPNRITQLAQDDPTWTELSIQQRMLETGRSLGGTHFAIIDADELLSGNLLPDFRSLLAQLGPGDSLWLPWLAMWKSLDHCRDDDTSWTNNFLLHSFRDGPDLAYIPREDGYDMHARWPDGLSERKVRGVASQAEGGVMHLQFAHRRRLVTKHAWYKMMELIRWPDRQPAETVNRRYNRTLDESELRVSSIPNGWWSPYDDLRALIDFDDEPWHAAECRRLWAEHGPERFEGLDLWGVPQGAEEDFCRA